MSHTVGGSAGDGSGLELRPFRALRYAPDRVDVGAATSPPYDVIGAAEAKRLADREPHNLVRLTLADPAADPGARYGRAAALLRRWQDEGVLRRDPRAALYVYEERRADTVHRGLLGAVSLRAPEQRVILPHEDVHPGPVSDRLAQMRATNANLEPIYLLVQGAGAAGDVVSAASRHRPLVEATVALPDGRKTYRLWSVTEPAALATVAAALRERQALIADGHHRYTAYRQLQADASGPGPRDFGLAFLMDAETYLPTLQPIHRVVAALPPAELVAALPPGAFVSDPVARPDELPKPADGMHRFVLAGDGRCRAVLLPASHPEKSARAHSAAWYRLDVTVLHQLLEGSLRLPEEQLGFAHGAAEAIERAVKLHGSAILLDPPAVTDVHAVAAAGDRMPRKSTSFGPKPLGGLVLRTLTK